MRRLLLLLCLFAGAFTFAQAPNQFKYQAVARDNSGAILANQSVGFEIAILQNSSGGTSVYTETHAVTTNEHGLVSLNIGGGAVVSGDFSTIDWGGAIYFLQVKLDAAGGTSYVLMGSTQLLSVPYALNAKSVSSIDWSNIQNVPADIADGDDDTNTDVLAGLTCSPNEVAMWNGSNWVCSALSSGTSGQDATDAYGTGQITMTVASTAYTLIPGLSQTITVPANAKVYVHTNGGVQTVGTGTTYGIADIGIHVDGTLMGSGGQQRVVSANTSGLGNMIDKWGFGKTYTLTPGVHTIDVRAKDGGGTADINVSSGTSPLIQGVLTVIIINQ